MKEDFKVPWHRYSVIPHLAHELREASPQFGKTALQKMVYLLQEVNDVPLGYRFSLYNYGPYAQELASDLALVEALGAVKVTYVEEDPGGYEITDGPNSARIRERGGEFLAEHKSKIDHAISSFGHLRARVLELYTTAIFVAHSLSQGGNPPTIKKTIDSVYDLKPYFALEEIHNVVDELRLRGIIRLRDDGG